MKKSVKRSLDAYIRQMDRIDLRVIACVILLNVFGLIMGIQLQYTGKVQL